MVHTCSVSFELMLAVDLCYYMPVLYYTNLKVSLLLKDTSDIHCMYVPVVDCVCSLSKGVDGNNCCQLVIAVKIN